MIKKIALTAGALAPLLVPHSAMAQIVYQPVAASAGSNLVAVPTVTTSVLLLMIVLTIGVAWWGGLNRKAAGKILGILGVAFMASGVFSVQLISEVYAGGGGGPGGTVIGLIDSGTGGSVPINETALNVFENTSGTRQRIIQINVTTCPNVDSGSIDGVDQCKVNSVVSTDKNGLCYVDCRLI